MGQPMTQIDLEAKKILYRCTHRGTKELDLILGNFARGHLPRMDAATLAAFAEFIELPEPVLHDMMTQRADLPPTMPAHLRAWLSAFRYRPEGS